MDVDLWREARKRKERELASALSASALTKNPGGQSALIDIENAFQMDNFDELEALLERTCNQYAQRKMSKLLIEKLYPLFDHIKSFTDSITASTQSNGYASLCWGALLAVIKVSYFWIEHATHQKL